MHAKNFVNILQQNRRCFQHNIKKCLIMTCCPGCVPPDPQRRGRHGDPGRAGHAGPGRRLRTRGRQPAPARPRPRQEGRHRLPGHQQNCAVITTTLYLFIYCQVILIYCSSPLINFLLVLQSSVYMYRKCFIKWFPQTNSSRTYLADIIKPCDLSSALIPIP